MVLRESRDVLVVGVAQMAVVTVGDQTRRNAQRTVTAAQPDPQRLASRSPRQDLLKIGEVFPVLSRRRADEPASQITCIPMIIRDANTW